jgi:hypothetical protein
MRIVSPLFLSALSLAGALTDTSASIQTPTSDASLELNARRDALKSHPISSLDDRLMTLTEFTYCSHLDGIIVDAQSPLDATLLHRPLSRPHSSRIARNARSAQRNARDKRRLIWDTPQSRTTQSRRHRVKTPAEIGHNVTRNTIDAIARDIARMVQDRYKLMPLQGSILKNLLFSHAPPSPESAKRFACFMVRFYRRLVIG